MSTTTPAANLRLGKKPYKHDPRTLKLSSYVDTTKLPTGPLDFTKTVKTWGMLGNDVAGDCAPVGELHLRLARSTAAGHAIVPTTADAFALYKQVSGWDGTPGSDSDQGVVLLDMLNLLRKQGKIIAFAKIDSTDDAMIAAAHYLFGGVLFGFGLPAYLQANPTGTWKLARGKLTGPRAPNSWGGHCVCSANGAPLKVVTWDKVVSVTPGFIDAYSDEAWAILTPEWLKTTGESPTGFDRAQLLADVAALGGKKAAARPLSSAWHEATETVGEASANVASERGQFQFGHLSTGWAGVPAVNLTPARPAETAGAAAAIATLLSIVLGVTDPQVIAAEVVAVGAIPAIVSAIVSAGGIRGVLRKIWGG